MTRRDDSDERTELKSYRDLVVWQKAMDLVVAIYRLTDSFPSHEQYGLRAQVRNAAVSVPSNIAEGYARSHRGDYRRHLSIARGSLAETETQLILAVRLDYLDRDATLAAWDLAQEVGKMLGSLLRSLSDNRNTPT